MRSKIIHFTAQIHFSFSRSLSWGIGIKRRKSAFHWCQMKGGVEICYSSFGTRLDTLLCFPLPLKQNTKDYSLLLICFIKSKTWASLIRIPTAVFCLLKRVHWPLSSADYPSSVYFLYKTKSLFWQICTRGLLCQ